MIPAYRVLNFLLLCEMAAMISAKNVSMDMS